MHLITCVFVLLPSILHEVSTNAHGIPFLLDTYKQNTRLEQQQQQQLLF
jgi:hypothetical protein